MRLAADDQLRVDEHVQRVTDHALDGVLYRHHAVAATIRRHLTEHLLDARERARRRRAAEMLAHRGLGESARRSQVGDIEFRLQGQTGRDQLAKDARQAAVVHRPRVARHDPPQLPGFPLRTVEMDIRPGASLDRGGLQHLLRPPADQIDQLIVDGVDLRAHDGERVFILVIHGNSLTRNAC